MSGKQGFTGRQEFKCAAACALRYSECESEVV